MVASKTDSRIILDEMGSGKLLGKGDMLYVSAAQPFPTRMQGAFVSEQEVERVVACVKEYCEPEYIDDESLSMTMTNLMIMRYFPMITIRSTIRHWKL